MVYYGAQEMAIGFRAVRANTLKIADDIGEEHYGFKAVPAVRSIGELLVHIAFIPTFQAHVHQNRIADLSQIDFAALVGTIRAGEAQPRSKREILTLLEVEGERFAAYLDTLSESFLAEQVAMPPGDPRRVKSRFEMLISAKEHEMHHRGQLMLLERMVGVVPHMTRAMAERMAARAAAAAQ